MRTDAKIGVLCALIVGLVAGGYFTFRRPSEEPIPLGAALPGKTSHRPAERRRPNQTKKRVTDTGRSSTHDRRSAKTGQPIEANKLKTEQGGTKPLPRAVAQNAAKTGLASDRDPSRSLPLPLTGLTDARNPSDPAPGLPAPGSGGAVLDDAARSSKPGLVGVTTPGGSDSDGVGRKPRTRLPAAVHPSRTAMKPPTGGRNETHTVQAGDTFSSISQQYYGDQRHIRALIKANPQVPNPDVLKIGQVVQIPRSGDGQMLAGSLADATRSTLGAAPSGARTYVVQSGDSFYKIAGDELGDPMRWQDLFELNRPTVGDNPNNLRTGAVLVLPKE